MNLRLVKTIKFNALNCQILTVRKKYVSTKLRLLTMILTGKLLTAAVQKKFSAGNAQCSALFLAVERVLDWKIFFENITNLYLLYLLFLNV